MAADLTAQFRRWVGSSRAPTEVGSSPVKLSSAALRIVLAAAALSTASIVVASGCGSTDPAKCTAENCVSGCCTAAGIGVNQPEQRDAEWETAGAPCRECLPGKSCQKGACVSSGPCDATNCDG